MDSTIELLSSRSAGLSVQDDEAAMELKKLPAKKKLLSQLKQQNAIQNQQQPPSISVIPLASQQAQTVTKMDQDDDEIAAHDDDSPLDMRITKQPDSDELRPSVIRRAPSFKENSNSPIFCDPAPCDPTMNIEEHFRRSLGTDYDLIIRNNLEQEHLALQKQRMLEAEAAQQLILQKQQQQEAAAAAALLAVKQQQQQQQQQQVMIKHHKKHQIHQHQAMLIAKQQQNPASLITTPPSTPSPPVHVQQSSPISLQAPNIVTIPQQQVKQQVIINEDHDNEEEMMSVDDHFAKALGEDTWKQFSSSDRK